MIINILGKSDKVCNAELKFAASFFAQYIMGTRLAKLLHITIALKEQGSRTDGRCLPVDLFEKRPRIFVIGINPKMSRNKILQAIAHEMVHVKQFARRELLVGWNEATFKGVAYKLSEDIEAYYSWPWEIEAYGRDRSLFFFYKVVLKQENVEFRKGRLYIGGKMMRKQKGK